MRFPKLALFVALLSPALMSPAFAQRSGGGHSGGGARSGGGGSFRGGGGSAFRGGSVFRGGGGFRGGGFYGGHYYGGTRFYFGLGGWGYPYYGYYGYAPYYYGYGYDPYYYPYSYGYDPNVYDSYPQYSAPPPAPQQNAPQQGYGYPQQSPPPQQASPPQYQPQTQPQSSNEYDQGQYYLIAFNDHTMEAATAYKVNGDQIRWITREGQEKSAPLSSVDIRYSRQVNADRHIDFQIP